MKQELTSDLRNFWKTVDSMQRTSKIRKSQFFQISEKFDEFDICLRMSNSNFPNFPGTDENCCKIVKI